MSAILMRKIAGFDELWAAQDSGEPGVFFFGDVVEREDGVIDHGSAGKQEVGRFRYRQLWVLLPANADGSGTSLAGLPLNAEGEAEVWWSWDGNEDAPTLSPSVWHDKPSGWHGFIRNGRLVSA